MEIDEIVLKLVGETSPVGDSNIDIERLKNLGELIQCVDKLLVKMETLSCIYRNRKEHSVSRIGKRAYNFLEAIGQEYKDMEGF